VTTIRIGYFTASPVLAVGTARGLFAEHGVAVEAEPVESSPAQFRSLRDGDYDMILTSPDNVATYRSGTDNPLGTRLDVRIVRAIDGGMGLCLIGAEGVRTIDDLRGGVLAVDVPRSGFAFALYEMLARHGLTRGTDYQVEASGSTPRRAVALREGRCAATLLNGALAVTATDAGLPNLGRVSDVITPYLGTVLAATGAWLDSNPGAVRRFAIAWQRAVTAVLTEDVDDLLAEVFGITPAQVPAVRTILRSPIEGLVPDGHVDQQALDNVLRLRARHDG
jgi:ABC-type nitrate/sulfonate/bicarbonate transport system substrate-binding protein